MFIFRTSLSASGRSSSIDSNPFFRSADTTRMPSASTELAGGDAAVQEFALGIVVLTAAHHQLVFFHGDVEVVFGEACDRQRYPQPFDTTFGSPQAFDVVGRITVAVLGKALQGLFHGVEAKQERAGKWRHA